MGIWPGDPHLGCKNDLTPRRGFPMELVASSEQGLQASPFTLPLQEAQRFPLCTAGEQRSPVSNGQAKRQFHLAA